jgi:hypothetical protein
MLSSDDQLQENIDARPWHPNGDPGDPWAAFGEWEEWVEAKTEPGDGPGLISVLGDDGMTARVNLYAIMCEMSDRASALARENERLREAGVAVLDRLYYLREVWGDEGLTRSLCDRIRLVFTPPPAPVVPPPSSGPAAPGSASSDAGGR